MKINVDLANEYQTIDNYKLKPFPKTQKNSNLKVLNSYRISSKTLNNFLRKDDDDDDLKPVDNGTHKLKDLLNPTLPRIKMKSSKTVCTPNPNNQIVFSPNNNCPCYTPKFPHTKLVLKRSQQFFDYKIELKPTPYQEIEKKQLFFSSGVEKMQKLHSNKKYFFFLKNNDSIPKSGRPLKVIKKLKLRSIGNYAANYYNKMSIQKVENFHKKVPSSLL